MSLTTPNTIRTLQRKLYAQAKQETAYCYALNDWVHRRDILSRASKHRTGKCACLGVKNIGKPCAGKLHARFDEGGQARACPLLYLGALGAGDAVEAKGEQWDPVRVGVPRAFYVTDDSREREEALERPNKGDAPLYWIYTSRMPRLARPVFPGVPHHITQRGNRREDVFFSDEDRAIYLAWLDEYCVKHKVSVLAYCLMTNHIHVVAVPETEDALEKMFRPLHTRYAQRINRARQWQGHLWQGRFFSSALDEHYLWAAIRYVERNPVRARIVRRAENYPWSSAAAHCGLKQDGVLASEREWETGSTWLADGERPEQLTVLRRHVERGLPCGAEGFIRRLERRAGKMLRPRPRGRPKKVEQKE